MLLQANNQFPFGNSIFGDGWMDKRVMVQKQVKVILTCSCQAGCPRSSGRGGQQTPPWHRSSLGCTEARDEVGLVYIHKKVLK